MEMMREGTPLQRKRVLVVYNPVAGGGHRGRLNAIVEAMRATGLLVSVEQTVSREQAEQLVASGTCRSFDVVAAAGGDGTINGVLNGLGSDGPPLAVLPLGTANVLAIEIGLSGSIRSIAETIAFGPEKRVSLGEANGKRFAVMASAGLDAHVVAGVNLKLKRYVGKSAYLIETMRRMVRLPTGGYRLRIDGKETIAQGVIIANGRHYAGRYIPSPRADLAKPSLDVCRLLRPGRMAAAAYWTSLMRGRLAERADFVIDEAVDIELTGPAGEPLQADGDILTHLPATVRVLPDAARLIYPCTRRPDFRGAPSL